MDPRHLEDLIAIERTYWWHVSKRALVQQLLHAHAPAPCTVMEGGVGGGLMLRSLADKGYSVAGFDLSPQAVHHCHQLGLSAVTVHDLQTPWPVQNGSVGAVLLLDVLEHLINPVDVLRYVACALVPGGVAIITVPAIPLLLGPWDKMLGHLRRYSRSMLQHTVTAAGLGMRWVSHWNAFSLPPAILVRGVERLGGRPAGPEFPHVHPAVNTALVLAARAERALLRHTSLPVGLSLVAVLEKRS